MNELQILTAIKNNGKSIEYTKLLTCGLADPKPNGTADKQRLKHLLAENYISGQLTSYGKISLTPKGQIRLDELTDKSEEKAENKAQQRFENKISVLNLLIPLVTFALGVVVEHYVSIVDWFFTLFH